MKYLKKYESPDQPHRWDVSGKEILPDNSYYGVYDAFAFGYSNANKPDDLLDRFRKKLNKLPKRTIEVKKK